MGYLPKVQTTTTTLNASDNTMPSVLLHLRYNVKWEDFQGPPDMKDPGLAGVATTYLVSGGEATHRKERWYLADSITVKIVINRTASWAKKDLIKPLTWPQEQALLKHEQGHYDISALMGRDLFLELMLLKKKPFRRVGSLMRAYNALIKKFAADPIQVTYDSKQETDHSTNAAKQQAWNGYIRTAFTQPRQPPVLDPQGAPYKTRLLDVLKKAAIKISTSRPKSKKRRRP